MKTLIIHLVSGDLDKRNMPSFIERDNAPGQGLVYMAVEGTSYMTLEALRVSLTPPAFSSYRKVDS